MQTALFMITAVVVYAVTAWIVKTIDARRDQPMPNRPIVFFILFFALILVAFELLKFLLAMPA